MEILQAAVDNRRARIKAPVKRLLAVVEEQQLNMSDNSYLQMANACRDMYNILEELDPTSVEGYNVAERTMIESTEAEQRVADLEECCRRQETELMHKNFEIERLKSNCRAVQRERNAQSMLYFHHFVNSPAHFKHLYVMRELKQRVCVIAPIVG